MPKLKCEVEQCAYNYDWLCKKNFIDVDGISSRNKKETSCGSYVLKNSPTDNALSSLNYEFAALNEMPRLQTEVYCDAVNCVFEKNQKCFADRIEIKTNHENAKIHDKESCACTNCQTFECKD